MKEERAVKRWLAVLVLLAAAIGLGYAAFNGYWRSQPEQCYACQRLIHAHSRTVAIVDGKPRTFCCPACALSEHEQERKPIRVTELTDYLTGARLSQKSAFLVKGSDVNMCVRAHSMLDADKRAAQLHYDRCLPGLLAFASEDQAMQFAREHGGQVLPFEAIVSQFSH
jgi:hypothetical protein